jgi:hypothetical protein
VALEHSGGRSWAWKSRSEAREAYEKRSSAGGSGGASHLARSELPLSVTRRSGKARSPAADPARHNATPVDRTSPAGGRRDASHLTAFPSPGSDGRVGRGWGQAHSPRTDVPNVKFFPNVSHFAPLDVYLRAEKGKLDRKVAASVLAVPPEPVVRVGRRPQSTSEASRWSCRCLLTCVPDAPWLVVCPAFVTVGHRWSPLALSHVSRAAGTPVGRLGNQRAAGLGRCGYSYG